MTGRLDSEVIIIGGGATGAGIARDCARRGLRTLLIERMISPPGRPAGIMDCCTAAPVTR